MRTLAAEPTNLTSGFWKEASAHRLVVPRCNQSGAYFFPPERCVPGTVSTDWSFTQSCGTGTVTTFTIVYRAPSAEFDVPYVLAVVTIDEGWDYLTNIVGCQPDEVNIGMPVQVTFLDIDGASLPVFMPVMPSGSGEME